MFIFLNTFKKPTYSGSPVVWGAMSILLQYIISFGLPHSSLPLSPESIRMLCIIMVASIILRMHLKDFFFCVMTNLIDLNQGKCPLSKLIQCSDIICILVNLSLKHSSLCGMFLPLGFLNAITINQLFSKAESPTQYCCCSKYKVGIKNNFVAFQMWLLCALPRKPAN